MGEGSPKQNATIHVSHEAKQTIWFVCPTTILWEKLSTYTVGQQTNCCDCATPAALHRAARKKKWAKFSSYSVFVFDCNLVPVCRADRMSFRTKHLLCIQFALLFSSNHCLMFINNCSVLSLFVSFSQLCCAPSNLSRGEHLLLYKRTVFSRGIVFIVSNGGQVTPGVHGAPKTWSGLVMNLPRTGKKRAQEHWRRARWRTPHKN